MAYEYKPNTGSLFKNDKEGNEGRPDYKGGASLQCPHCTKTFLQDVSSWINTAKTSGVKYLGLVFARPYKKPEAAAVGTSGDPQAPPNRNDDIPF